MLTASPSALYYSECNEAVPDFREVRIPLWPTEYPVYASPILFVSKLTPPSAQHSVGVGG